MAENDKILLRRYHEQGDLQAREQLIEQYMSLVRSLARRYSYRGEQLDDLVQIGSIGLIKAIDRFDINRGVELTTYATPNIIGEIKRHFRDRGWAVRVPRGLQELNVRLSKLIEQLTVQLGRSPTIPELAKAAGVDEEDVLEALESGRAYSSLSLSTGGGTEDGEELDPLESLGEIEHQYEVSEDRAVLAPGFKVLDPRERQILHLRFFEGLTQSQIAQHVGISQMHVSRLIRRALEKIRAEIADARSSCGSPTRAERKTRFAFGRAWPHVTSCGAELREAFQRFYEERGHLRVPGHSLIPPAEDLSTLFISAGMQQFKPYFLRTKEPPSPRVVSIQQCLRAGGKDTDLEEVGRTERHCSFFEMMGNFSFGDYYKDEAVDFAWEWVTEVLGLEPDRLWATVHEGDPALEPRRGRGGDRRVAAQGNPAGAHRQARQGQLLAVGRDRPVRPVLGDLLRPRRASTHCGDPNCGPGHCDRIMEIYNLVFMAYDLQPGNVLVDLPTPNVDTGNGLERTACVLQDVSSVFDTDGFRQIMDWIEAESGVPYRESDISLRAHRVLADHGRAASFLIAEGIEPSNEGRGYICRRLLRRAIHQASRIGLHDSHRLSRVVVGQMGEAYPQLAEHADEIERVWRGEEERFSETLARGQRVFDDLADRPAIDAEDAFTLAATYGFPIELTQELAEERGQPVDIDGFRDADGGASRRLARRRRQERPAARGRVRAGARASSRSSSATRSSTC